MPNAIVIYQHHMSKPGPSRPSVDLYETIKALNEQIAQKAKNREIKSVKMIKMKYGLLCTLIFEKDEHVNVGR